MKLIDGKQLAQNLRGEIAAGVERLKAEKGVTPGLAVILVGDNPASVSYVTAKEKACAEAGMLSREIRLPAETTEADLVALVRELNEDPAIHGILVQLPVPKHISDKAVIDAIAPEKDVDGFTPVNVGRMMIGERCFLPCTPHGIIKLIEFSGLDLKGKHAVVIGRSNIVGKPVAALLSRKETNATVTLCHTGTASEHAHRRHAQAGSRGDRRRREPRSGRDEAEGLQARRRRGLRKLRESGRRDNPGAWRGRSDDDHDAPLEHPRKRAQVRRLKILRTHLKRGAQLWYTMCRFP